MFNAELIQGGEGAPNIPELSWEERRFQNSDGNKLAIYSEPNEFHMGSYDWKLSIFDNGHDVTKSQTALSQLNPNLKFHVPTNFQPWSPDDNWLSLATWQEAHFHYNIPQQKIIKSTITGHVLALLWSPKILRYIVSVHNWRPVRSQSLYVAGTELSTAIQLNVDIRTEEEVSLWWLKCGSRFLALYRSSKESFPTLELFAAGTGLSQGKISVDPNKFIPYDEVNFRHISRGRFSLQITPSTRCVGDFLDVWNRIYFDADTSRLALSVYRPAGDEIHKHDEAILPVKERWCILQLTF